MLSLRTLATLPSESTLLTYFTPSKFSSEPAPAGPRCWRYRLAAYLKVDVAPSLAPAAVAVLRAELLLLAEATEVVDGGLASLLIRLAAYLSSRSWTVYFAILSFCMALASAVFWELKDFGSWIKTL